MTNLTTLPEHLPEPLDDGACDHLKGRRLPAITRQGSDGAHYDLSRLKGLSVIFVYPMTGQPGMALPFGWDEIPGARGCTTEVCGFRDNMADYTKLGIQVFGLSSQSPAAQQEAAERLALPYPLLSDENLAFARALELPLFDTDGMRLIKRLTLICRAGLIEQCVYPVFPPDTHASQLLAVLKQSALRAY